MARLAWEVGRLWEDVMVCEGFTVRHPPWVEVMGWVQGWWFYHSYRPPHPWLAPGNTKPFPSGLLGVLSIFHVMWPFPSWPSVGSRYTSLKLRYTWNQPVIPHLQTAAQPPSRSLTSSHPKDTCRGGLTLVSQERRGGVWQQQQNSSDNCSHLSRKPCAGGFALL